jgi:hypothetical protein
MLIVKALGEGAVGLPDPPPFDPQPTITTPKSANANAVTSLATIAVCPPDTRPQSFEQ